ncbi:MAG: thioesterase family protein [Candidatus Poribacteria bacterium]|nr:thioesterase family protein [Candidatus Poribacteria bacterium]
MPYEYRTKRQVEFSDTDMAGIAHFSRFFVFMESAEHEFLRSLGTSVATEWDGNKIGWPRLAASCEYLQPVKFEDTLDIHLTVSRKGRKSMTYEFVFTKDDLEIARGQMSTACCACNPGEKIRAIPIPDFIADQIEVTPSSARMG